MTTDEAPQPPSQTYFLPGNLLDLDIYTQQLLTAFATRTATLETLANFATALNDTTTCLRWLLDNLNTPTAQALTREFTLPELKTETP